jgi:hypothetical protein
MQAYSGDSIEATSIKGTCVPYFLFQTSVANMVKVRELSVNERSGNSILIVILAIELMYCCFNTKAFPKDY